MSDGGGEEGEVVVSRCYVTAVCLQRLHAQLKVEEEYGSQLVKCTSSTSSTLL